MHVSAHSPGTSTKGWRGSVITPVILFLVVFFFGNVTSVNAAETSTMPGWLAGPTLWLTDKWNSIYSILPVKTQKMLGYYLIASEQITLCMLALLLGIIFGLTIRQNRKNRLKSASLDKQLDANTALSAIMQLGKNAQLKLLIAASLFSLAIAHLVYMSYPVTPLHLAVPLFFGYFCGSLLGWWIGLLTSAMIYLATCYSTILIPAISVRLLSDGSTLGIYSVFVGFVVASFIITQLCWFIRRNLNRRILIPQTIRNYWKFFKTKMDQDLRETLLGMIPTKSVKKNADLALIKATLLKDSGKDEELLSLLAQCPASPETDALQVATLDKLDQTDKALAKLNEYPYPGEEISKLLKALPNKAEKSAKLLLQFFAAHKDWPKVKEVSKNIRRDQIIPILEELAPSTGRDRILLEAYASAKQWDSILKLAQEYDFGIGRQLLEETMPKSSQVYQLFIRYFDVNRREDELREYLHSLNGKDATEALIKVKKNELHEQLLIELLYQEESSNELLQHVPEIGRLVNILESLPASLPRDRHLATLSHQQDHLEEAVSRLELYLKDDALTRDDLELLADCHQKLNNTSRYLDTLASIYRTLPDDEDCLKRLVEACRQSNSLHQSLVDDQEEILMIEFADQDLYGDLRTLYLNHDQQQCAIRCAEKGAERNHHDSALFLGKRYYKQGDFTQANQYFLKGGTKGQLPAALCHFKLEQYPEAAALFSKLAETNQTKNKLLYHLGFSWAQAGKPDNALDVFEKLAKLESSQAVAEDIFCLCKTLASPHLNSGNYHDALGYLLRARQHLEKDHPASQELNELLFSCYYSLIYQALLSSDAKQPDIHKLIEDARATRSRTDRDLDILYCLWLLKERQTEKALSMLAISDKRHPGDPMIRLHKAIAALADGKKEYAENILQSLAAETNGSDYGTRTALLLATLALKDNDFQAARNYVNSEIKTEEEVA